MLRRDRARTRRPHVHMTHAPSAPLPPCRYFVGSLDLPIVNGPTEGLLFLVVMYAYSAVTDLTTGFWTEKSVR